MKTKSPVLTKEERDVLILAALHPNGERRSDTEIAQHLGIPVNRVKTLVHQACVRMKVHNRNEAIFLALIRGEIIPTEIYSLNELAEIVSSLSPDMLRRIAHLMRQEQEPGHLRVRYKQIIRTDRSQDTILTKRERDVLILAGRGLINKEIAERLCVSIGSVRIFLDRACAKLGAHTRAEAVLLAVKQREISVGDIASLDELLQALAPLGAEAIEGMARLPIAGFWQKPAELFAPYYGKQPVCGLDPRALRDRVMRFRRTMLSPA